MQKITYICPVCRRDISLEIPEEMDPESGEAMRDHCPNCLSAIHTEDEDGLECGGTWEPISVWVQEDDSWELIQRCNFCGELRTVPLAEDDDPIHVLSIAMQPLAQPPFPMERMQELTDLMGGQGSTEGYRRGQS